MRFSCSAEPSGTEQDQFQDNNHRSSEQNEKKQQFCTLLLDLIRFVTEPGPAAILVLVILSWLAGWCNNEMNPVLGKWEVQQETATFFIPPNLFSDKVCAKCVHNSRLSFYQHYNSFSASNTRPLLPSGKIVLPIFHSHFIAGAAIFAQFTKEMPSTQQMARRMFFCWKMGLL